MSIKSIFCKHKYGYIGVDQKSYTNVEWCDYEIFGLCQKCGTRRTILTLEHRTEEFFYTNGLNAMINMYCKMHDLPLSPPIEKP